MSKSLYWLAVAVCIAGIVLKAISIFFAASVWDDAFMFVRYADHLLEQGKISWNPGGEPSFGLTSLLFLAIVVPIRLAISDNPALTASLSSLLSGFLFLGLLIVLILRYTDGTVWVRRGLLLFVLVSLFASVEVLAAHFVSGMDTAFALVYATALIFLAKKYERSPSQAHAVWFGLAGGLAFSARPDLLLYSFAIPLSLIVFASESRTRRSGLIILGIVSLVVVLQMTFYSLYFRSLLPLSFYAKSTRFYGDFMYQKYRLIPVQELYTFVTKSYWLLFLPIGVSLAINFKDWQRTFTPVEKGLLAGTCLFLFYYLFFALQIMYYNQRFYFPTLPAIAFLAAQSVAAIVNKIPPLIKLKAIDLLSGVRESRWLFATLALFAFGMLLPKALSISVGMASGLAKGDPIRFNLLDDYRVRLWDFWYRLDEFSALPDNLVVATTEVGYPAAMNPRKAIVDLSGLNETSFAHNGFSSRRLLEEYRPDLIYLPFPDYKEMIEQIESDSAFQTRYEYHPARSLGTLMGVALRRDSAYYSQMRNIVENGMPR